MANEIFQETIDQLTSVLPAISKIMERILYDQLYNYLTKFEVLSDS
jgi:hypothetical protein